MGEMIERVAKAIDDAVKSWEPGCGERIGTMAARAAIEAMRYPTRAMIDAGSETVWMDMINEALK